QAGGGQAAASVDAPDGAATGRAGQTGWRWTSGADGRDHVASDDNVAGLVLAALAIHGDNRAAVENYGDGGGRGDRSGRGAHAASPLISRAARRTASRIFS